MNLAEKMRNKKAADEEDQKKKESIAADEAAKKAKAEQEEREKKVDPETPKSKGKNKRSTPPKGPTKTEKRFIAMENQLKSFQNDLKSYKEQFQQAKSIPISTPVIQTPEIHLEDLLINSEDIWGQFQKKQGMFKNWLTYNKPNSNKYRSHVIDEIVNVCNDLIAKKLKPGEKADGKTEPKKT